MSSSDFTTIENKIATLDTDHIFDYAYTVDPDIEISDPLAPESFLDPYHPFNAYTICQMITDDGYNQFKILNIRKS